MMVQELLLLLLYASHNVPRKTLPVLMDLRSYGNRFY